jgi:hypothetical protein
MARKKQNGAFPPKSAQTVTFFGYVDEVDNEDGTTGVRITTEDAESVRIHLDEKGMELLDLVDEEIVVTGAVQTDCNGGRILWVKNYELIDNNPDEFDEDPDDDYDDYDEFRGDDDFRDDDDDRPWRSGTGTDV